MSKRRGSESLESPHAVKRACYSPDRLSNLSDELLLRVLANVPVSSLAVCQRVSRRFNAISGDSQLWKAAYYDRFVRPRAKRLPGVKNQASNSRLDYSSKASIWLDEEKLVKAGKKTNWKRQYKLSNNWSCGNCDMKEIQLAPSRSIPPLLARLHNGIVYTVDSISGLRAWSYKDEHNLLATGSLSKFEGMGACNLPASIALDSQQQHGTPQRIVIGFEDGHFSCYEFSASLSSFQHLYSHPPSSNGAISALAFSWPYVLSMTETQLLSIYSLAPATVEDSLSDSMAPSLLTSLKSHTVWPPLSLSLRLTDDGLVASIAFSVPTFMSGWSTGVQELCLRRDGTIVESRLTSAIDRGFRPLTGLQFDPNDQDFDETEQNQDNMPASPIFSTPTSLSYSHPYLLASHSDNTLTLYLVTSTATKLSMSKGKRLWGHTSGVSGAHIAGRGKAVSVSMKGNELRVWELEGSTMQTRSRARPPSRNLSVQVTPEKRPSTPYRLHQLSEAITQRGTGLGLATESNFEDSVFSGWVGFDDSNVVVLRENRQGKGSEALMVYDFT